jgi:hypothetical protein
MRLDLDLATPWMNAAGAAGFAPPERWPWPEPPGCWVSNPLSLGPRLPAENRTLLPYPGGALLHSGLPNPGVSAVVRARAASWARCPLPGWVHIIGQTAAEIHQLILRLEGLEGVAALELGVPDEMPGPQALAQVEAALGELPLVVNIPLNRAGEAWLTELDRLGVSAISLAGPRGCLADGQGTLVSGRLFGPGLFPLVVRAVELARRWRLPVIAGAGVYSFKNAQTLIQAGAWGVQFDTALWL